MLNVVFAELNLVQKEHSRKENFEGRTDEQTDSGMNESKSFLYGIRDKNFVTFECKLNSCCNVSKRMKK